MNKSVVTAIENKNLLEFQYEGENRIVEPHCYGETTAGNEGLRAYQVDGYSSSGRLGWRMYDLGKAEKITLLDTIFHSPREGYSKGDKGMQSIYMEL